MARNLRFAGNDARKEGEISPPSIPLSSDEVHIWRASLEQPPEGVVKFSSLLSPDEELRARRFYFERDRNRFIVGRGLLRTILGNYLAMEPSLIEFSYGPYGKPALKTVFHDKTLQFNLSHSNSLAVFIFSWDRRVGIDIEFIHALSSEDRFAEQLFSPRESALISSLSGEEKLNAFFKLWTCKEAVFKASGDGLTKPIDQAEILLTEGESVQLVSIDGDPEQAASWHLETFSPAPGYRVSLAVEGYDERIAFQQLDDYFGFL